MDDCAQLLEAWRRCRKHGALQQDLDRERIGVEAERLFRRLPLPPDAVSVFHPAAALRALDRYCATLGSAGSDPRKVDGHYLVRRPVGWASRYATTQPNHLEYWLREHQIVPVDHQGIAVSIDALGDVERLEPPFVAAVGGFTDGVCPNWSEPPYGCTHLLDATRRTQSVVALFEEARRAGAVVVVLPELTVDAEVLAAIKTWLQDEEHPFRLIAAGSFHVEQTGKRRNEATLLGRRGDTLLRHLKLQPMRHTVKRADGRTEHHDEDIEGNASLRLLHGPQGLVAVAICLDFCDRPSAPIASLWAEVGPALVLVPSMGEEGTNRAHGDRAKDLRRQHATRVLVASQHPDDATACGLAWFDGANEAESYGEKTPLLIVEVK